MDYTGFAAGFWDAENNGDHFGAREYESLHGTWRTPDPAGMAAADLSNPQTWNRYAYVTNNPVTESDPLGLYGGCDNCDLTFQPIWIDPFNSIGGVCFMCGTNTMAVPTMGASYQAYGGAAAAAFAYDPFVLNFQGTLYGKSYKPTFDTVDDYMGWRTSIAALPESQVYRSYALIAANQGLDPNTSVSVKWQYGAMVYGVWVPDLSDQSVDPAAAANDGGWSDPITFLHHRASSWYFGLWFDAGHLVDSTGSFGINAHIDPFGPLNPLHYLIQLPSMMFGSSPQQGASCSVNGGCTF
ncbi:MAG TPA: RHS repeat-associated core domain-containing protein [Terriglobales bacterium]|nr:RHS repeat-associated core domain-containing protein [Terriglobales bacterium]